MAERRPRARGRRQVAAPPAHRDWPRRYARRAPHAARQYSHRNHRLLLSRQSGRRGWRAVARTLRSRPRSTRTRTGRPILTARAHAGSEISSAFSSPRPTRSVRVSVEPSRPIAVTETVSTPGRVEAAKRSLDGPDLPSAPLPPSAARPLAHANRAIRTGRRGIRSALIRFRVPRGLRTRRSCAVVSPPSSLANPSPSPGAKPALCVELSVSPMVVAVANLRPCSSEQAT